MIAPLFVAASCLGPQAHGNDRTRLRPWPADLARSFSDGNPDALHWSLLFESDPGRFGRMDLMSRLGLMAVELLDLPWHQLGPAQRDRVAVLVETTAGSILTDLQHLQTPRASLFTYTLPSTVVGEICIRHRLCGPVLCLVTASPDDPSPAIPQALHWLAENEADACICLRAEAVDPKVRESLTAEPEAKTSLGLNSPWLAAALFVSRLPLSERLRPLPLPTEQRSLVTFARHLIESAS